MSPRNRHRARRRGFSLVEVLLGIFILGIGIIAIAALFPAGIAQQRQSVDDIIGPLVANNAISVLRLKLKQEDFGTFEEFTPGATLTAPMATIEGDWPWMRPGQLRSDDPSTPAVDEAGSYDVFSARGTATSEWNCAAMSGYMPPSGLTGIPYSTALYGVGPPEVIVTQGDRYYPMASVDEFVGFVNPDNRRPKPQYVWDCAFRRYQGRVLVGIFVYRVSVVGGGSVTYRIPTAPGDPDCPLLPAKMHLAPPMAWNAGWGTVPGTAAGAVYNPSSIGASWQEPRQWLLDGNNNVHRVLSASRNAVSDPMAVELVRPAAELPILPTNFFLPTAADTNGNGLVDQQVVSCFLYIPTEVTANVPGPQIGGGNTRLSLTPVYVTVKEL